MADKIVIHEMQTDDLHKRVWRYWFNDSRLQLWLDKYVVMERQTRRHKWVMVAKWEKNCRWELFLIKREDVPVPEEVKEAVLKEFLSRITVE